MTVTVSVELVVVDGRKLVFRVDGDHVEAVPVSTGRRIGEVVELTGTALKSGERVVLDPAETLKPGARVAVVTK